MAARDLTDTRGFFNMYEELDDIPTLPVELLEPDTARFCEGCSKYLPGDCFLKRPRHRCKFCVARDRALAQREVVKVTTEDPLLKELAKELRGDNIQLPSIRDILNEFVVQEGGIAKSIKRIRRTLHNITKKNPHDRFPVTVRMGFLKLFMALEAVDKGKQAPSPELPIAETYALIERMLDKFGRPDSKAIAE